MRQALGLLAFLAALGAASTADAQSSRPYTTLLPGGGFVVTSTPSGTNFSTPSPRTWAATATGLSIVDQLAIPSAGGVITVAANWAPTAAVVAEAMVGAASLTPAGRAAFAAAAIILGGGLAAGPIAGFIGGDKLPAETVAGKEWSTGYCDTLWYPSPDSAAKSCNAAPVTPPHYYLADCAASPMDSNNNIVVTCFQVFPATQNRTGPHPIVSSLQSRDAMVNQCPSGTLRLSDAGCYSTPGSPGFEGAISTSEATRRLGLLTPEQLLGPARQMVENGGTIPGRPTVSGPSETPAETTTTTGPNGTTTTTSRTNIVYEGDRVTYGPTTVTVTNNNPTTNVTSTQTTVTNNSSSSSTAQAAADMCKANPNAAACKELGEAPAAPELPASQVGVTISAQEGWSREGSCPSYQASFLGQPVAIDFTLACQGLGYIKPVVLAVAWVLAGMILIGGIKQS